MSSIYRRTRRVRPQQDIKKMLVAFDRDAVAAHLLRELVKPEAASAEKERRAFVKRLRLLTPELLYDRLVFDKPVLLYKLRDLRSVRRRFSGRPRGLVSCVNIGEIVYRSLGGYFLGMLRPFIPCAVHSLAHAVLRRGR